LANKLKLILKE